jgi:hypothetical protein
MPVDAHILIILVDVNTSTLASAVVAAIVQTTLEIIDGIIMTAVVSVIAPIDTCALVGALG